MKNDSILTVSFYKGTSRPYNNQDGSKGEAICIADVGHIYGQYTALKALAIPGYTQRDTWRITNLVDQNNVFLTSVAVLGAISDEQAANFALRTFNYDYGAIAQINAYDVIEAPTFVLERLVNHASRENYQGRITQQEIDTLRAQITGKPVVWEENNCTSHASASHLIRDISTYDESRELLLPVKPEAIIKEVMDGAEIEGFDAVISQYSRLEALSKRVLVAMGKAAGEKVKPVEVTTSDPFKKNGVVNIATVFTMSDGQSVSIIYHNPDATPKRLDATDTLTSWKFLLNKRDVTAVLQPKSGKNVNIQTLAKRMMLIVEGNSARFMKGLARKAQAEQVLVDLEKDEQAKIQEEQLLDQEIAALQEQLDQPLSAAVITPEVKTEAAQEPIPAQQDPENEPVIEPDADKTDKEAYTIEEVATAFRRKTEMERQFTGGGLWYNTPEVYKPINYAVAQGWAYRISTTQAEWKEEGIEYLNQYRKDNPVVSPGAEAAKAAGFKTDKAGNILTLPKGKPFSVLSMTNRFKNTHNLSSYIPMKTEEGYVLHELEDEHFKATGKVIVGHPKYSEMVTEAEPRLIFQVHGETFYVVDSVQGTAKGLEVIYSKSHLSIPSKDEKGNDVFFYASVKQAHDAALATLEKMSKAELFASGLIKAMNSYDSKLAADIAQGREAQPIEVIKAKKQLASEQKKLDLNAQLDQLRDENGKLNPLSDNPMERVRANEEMNLFERYDHEENWIKFLNKTDSVDPADLANRHIDLLANKLKDAGKLSEAEINFAHEKLYELYQGKIERGNLDDVGLSVTQDRMEKSKIYLQQHGLLAEQTDPIQGNEMNPDEAWLDQIIGGEIDATTLNMDDFMNVAQKYASEPDQPIYAKLEEALNTVTKAKVAKAQGV